MPLDKEFPSVGLARRGYFVFSILDNPLLDDRCWLFPVCAVFVSHQVGHHVLVDQLG